MTERRLRRMALGTVVLLLAGCAAPTPTKPPRFWSYVRTPIEPFWWTTVVDVPGARKKGATGAGTSIAILGTGILAGHVDLPTVVPGVATCGPPSNTDDDNGHGTQLAGIAAGQDPGTVTRGVAPSATLIPIKTDCVVVTAPALMKGVDAAIARKPDVILIAIGGYPSSPDLFKFLLDRVDGHPEILFVVASAWDGVHYTFPEWTLRKNALLVAAMTLEADERNEARIRQDKEIPYTARRGTIWAPGRGVGTLGIETYSGPPTPYEMHGTSPAAAIVAGCAALVKSKSKPGTGGAALKEALVNAAQPKPDLPAPDNKRLDCGRATP